MAELTSDVLEVATLIVDTLNLENMTPDEIDPQAPLFRDGLGLDSIDALELSLGIKQKYGIHLKADDENIEKIFTSLTTLTDFISNHK
ncbi:MAG: acyl carrier protein [Candidatus Thiodiazotropha sp. (ex Cardiolucina cf. quadrata)]|nr:acyl carrier protein [Candidatus Thiodiazotropha sp. (ex Cardiolucina cf. quadrata)]